MGNRTKGIALELSNIIIIIFNYYDVKYITKTNVVKMLIKPVTKKIILVITFSVYSNHEQIVANNTSYTANFLLPLRHVLLLVWSGLPVYVSVASKNW